MRVHNTNTRKIIWSRFDLDDGLAAVDGELAIPGVAGTGAPVRLEFREPGGATTGKLLPTGSVRDVLDVPGYGTFTRLDGRCGQRLRVSSAPTSSALTGTEMPEAIDANTALLEKLAAIRIAASVAMGIAATPEEAKAKKVVPFIGFVSGPQNAPTLTGAVDQRERRGSHRPHDVDRAAASRAAADRIAVHGGRGAARRQCRACGHPRRPPRREAPIRIAMPSGMLTVAATVKKQNGEWHAEQGAFYPHAAAAVRRPGVRARVTRAERRQSADGQQGSARRVSGRRSPGSR